MNKIPEYKVKIANLDLYIIQGKSTLKNIEFWKQQGKIPVPFFKADTINFSIQWSALLKGRLVGRT